MYPESQYYLTLFLQMRRDTAMQQFRSGRTPILLATNVAARGIDVSDIKYVVNYDFPK